MLLFNLIFALSFQFAPAVHAGEGGNSGGGGVVVELDILAVRTFLRDNCAQFESFKKHHVDCAAFIKKVDEVGKSGLSVSHNPLTLEDGKAVDAINFKPARIEFGARGWTGAGSDIPLKAGFQAHEFLSLMGLERTGFYDISKDLVTELRTSRSFPAFAQSVQTSLGWIRTQVNKKDVDTAKNFAGVEKKTGRACGLFVTNKSSYDDAYENYFVVVGYRDAQSFDDYVGISAVKASGEKSETTVVLDSADSWGNSSEFNKLKIQLNVFGQPISARGTSDKRDIDCVLDGTLF